MGEAIATLKDFVWFTTHSWSYLQGERKTYFTGFWGAWRTFRVASRKDRATQPK